MKSNKQTEERRRIGCASTEEPVAVVPHAGQPASLPQSSKSMKPLLKLFALLLVLAVSVRAEIPMPRDHHYGFAHRILVESMAADDFVATLKNKKEAHLKRLWRDAERQSKDGDRVSSAGLGYKIFNIDDNQEVVVVILPEAKVTAEAFMVGAEFKEGKLVGSVYTLEKGLKRIILAAWRDGRHLNFGEGPGNDAEQFRDAIVKGNK